MRTAIPTFLLGAALFSGLLVLGACKQMEGERCQIDDDCADGLYCELSGNTRAVGGYCKSNTAPPPTVNDLSVKPAPMNDMAMTPPPPDLNGTD
jgi:hypothetical protein